MPVVPAHTPAERWAYLNGHLVPLMATLTRHRALVPNWTTPKAKAWRDALTVALEALPKVEPTP